MKVHNLIDTIFCIEDILDLEKYPNLYDQIKEESNFNKSSRGGRKMCRMTDPGMKYTIYGKSFSKKNYTETVSRIRNEIEQKLKFKKGYFNTCTLNYYPNGASGFRNHTDYMPDLEDPMIVVTLTLGHSNREMTIVNRNGQGFNVKLPHNSLLVMGPHAQRKWMHGIPKEKGKKESRLSLSFRRQKIK